MNNWEILGIEPTNDINVIRKAYSEKSRIYHPETHPEEFQQLHNAYKTLCRFAQFQAFINLHGDDDISDYDDIYESDEDGNLPESTSDENSHDDIYGSTGDETAYDDETAREYEDFLNIIETASQKESDDLRRLYQLDVLDDLLSRPAGISECHNYFSSSAFLDNQYNPEYIAVLSDAFCKPLSRPDSKTGYVGSCPKYMFIYLIISYGCLLPKVGATTINENIYHRELLEPLFRAASFYTKAYDTYTELEQDEKFIGERFAFYVYRSILDILDRTLVDRNELSQWIAWGFANEHTARLHDVCHCIPRTGPNAGRLSARFHTSIPRAPLIFDLMSYLLNRSNTPLLFADVLCGVCESFMRTPDCCDEIAMLHSECQNKLAG